MRILFVTQIVDQNDPALGFVCRWLSEFSKKFSSIEVVCLKEGQHSLPENVRVHSLGKEKGRRSRVLHALRFAALSWKLRNEYDAVFLHMNPEYLLAAGDQWVFGKKNIYLWYNHTVGSIWLRLAAPFTRRIFHTSPFAYPARYKNAQRMPAGVDTELFSPRPTVRNRTAIYFKGRVAPAKKVHILLRALRLLRKEIPSATATIVGPEDKEYGRKLQKEFSDLVAENAVAFLGPRVNENTPDLYASHGVSVNLTAAGNFDKTVLESASCGTPAIVSSRAFSGIIPDAWIISEDDPETLAQGLARMLALPENEYRALGEKERSSVVAAHSLAYLADRIAEELSS